LFRGDAEETIDLFESGKSTAVCVVILFCSFEKCFTNGCQNQYYQGASHNDADDQWSNNNKGLKVFNIVVIIFSKLIYTYVKLDLLVVML